MRAVNLADDQFNLPRTTTNGQVSAVADGPARRNMPGVINWSSTVASVVNFSSTYKSPIHHTQRTDLCSEVYNT